MVGLTSSRHIFSYKSRESLLVESVQFVVRYSAVGFYGV